MKIFATILLSLFIASCGSNPSKDSNKLNVRIISIDEIANFGLYSKSDEDLGLYEIPFYVSKGNSFSTGRAFREARDNLVPHCSTLPRSDYISKKLKPRPLMLSIRNSGKLSLDSEIVFVCIDNNFNEGNKNLLERVKYYASKLKNEIEKAKELRKKEEERKAFIRSLYKPSTKSSPNDNTQQILNDFRKGIDKWGNDSSDDEMFKRSREMLDRGWTN